MDDHPAVSRESSLAGSKADVDQLCINTIRTLSIDAVQEANSGHPGMPMGAATMAYILWTRHLRHNPRNPAWPDRDRFVLSAGHASMLLYSLLFLTGYDLTLEDLQEFRQWNSRTPGHPERGVTPGVEVTTGPLGQGVGNSVGLAIAERWLAATFNRPDNEVVNHYTYVLASDGDVMEGVAAEAASLAGTLRLGRLIVLYDANLITLSATTNLTMTEDVGARFEAYGWHAQRIDGHDPVAVDAALTVARAVEDRPSLIVARTHIGYGSPHTQDTWHAHGEPLGVEEVRLTKRALGWPADRRFYVPEAALREFRTAVERGADLEAAWRCRVDTHRSAHPSLADQFARALAGELPAGWEAHLPMFTPADGEMSTRDAGGAVINAVAGIITNLVGGSADLDPSTRTAMKGCGDFESPLVTQSDHEVPTQGNGRRRLGVRWAKHSLRSSRTRHGRSDDWNGASRRSSPVRRDVPVVLRLYAPGYPACGVEQGTRDLCLDPRQHRAWRRWSDPPAGRATGGSARHAQHDDSATKRRHRNRGGVAHRATAQGRPRGARAHSTEAAGAGSDGPGLRVTSRTRGVRPRRS